MKKTGEVIAPEAKAAMLVRRPVHEVFEALVNPEITSRFWFTKSNGRVEQGKTLEWRWDMYNLVESVKVTEVRKNEFISLAFPGGKTDNVVEITFVKRSASATFVSVVNKNWDVDDPGVIDQVVGATEGWALVLSALKAFLEHNIVLSVVADRHPDGIPGH